MQRTGLFELNAVVAVSTHRNFRRAATALGMSPSALSHLVSTLEERLGVRLFHRTTRSVALSQAGERFLERVQPALQEISLALEDVNALRETPRGTLRINASEVSARKLLAPVMMRFLERYPEMVLDLVTEGRFIDIVAEGFDAGVRAQESVPQDMVAVPCSPAIRFAVVGSPGYFAGRAKPKTPADLAEHRCIRSRLPSGVIYRWEFEKRGKEVEVDVAGPLILNNDQLKVDAALLGAGLTWVSEWQVEEHVAAGRLVRVLEDWTPPYPGLCLYYPGHRHVPAGLRALIGVIREAAREWEGR